MNGNATLLLLGYNPQKCFLGHLSLESVRLMRSFLSVLLYYYLVRHCILNIRKKCARSECVLFCTFVCHLQR